MLKTQPDYLDTISLSKARLIELRDNARYVLNELITPEGIYASVEAGWSGPYHSWFGRDSAITTDLLCASLEYGGDRDLAGRSLEGLQALAEWQGKKDDAATGEKTGKIPHEIRKEFNEVEKLQHAYTSNDKPWFIDPKDGLLKNWDSADSTPLWIIATIRTRHALGLRLDETTMNALRSGLGWILKNLEEYDGLIGFVGASEQPGRKYSGIHNQGWKDTYNVYQDSDGTLSPHPIKEVLVNAEAWAALRLGAGEFEFLDKSFADTLNDAARSLKKKFNDSETGFLIPGKSYFAQAIDGEGRQLKQIAADVPMCLWASYSGECILNGLYIDDVVKRTENTDMLNPEAGIRNYSVGTKFDQGTLYHGSPHTYWPFASALVSRGLHYYSYKSESRNVVTAYLSAIDRLGSNIEMFVETNDHELKPWHHPKYGQQSSKQQAWTAAAVYLGSLYLLNS